jgi:hypothetical protein
MESFLVQGSSAAQWSAAAEPWLNERGAKKTERSHARARRLNNQ